MGRVTTRRRVRRIGAEAETWRPDTLAVEEPMEIRVGGRSLAVTMRTPGDDIDLVHGFLLTEGVITDREDVVVVRYCDGVDETGANTYNVLDVSLAAGVAPPDPSVERNFYTTSSCGVCGKASLDAVRLTSRHVPGDEPATVTVDALTRMPDDLRAAQKVFDSTGGLHAAGLFTTDGQMLVLREDVGRHNAVDKVIGWAVREGRMPLSGCVLMVSGRASFELVQKAVMSGIPVLAAVSAPSSLAVELAEELGVTVVGFLRGQTMNVYSRPDRVQPRHSPSK